MFYYKDLDHMEIIGCAFRRCAGQALEGSVPLLFIRNATKDLSQANLAMPALGAVEGARPDASRCSA